MRPKRILGPYDTALKGPLMKPPLPAEDQNITAWHCDRCAGAPADPLRAHVLIGRIGIHLLFAEEVEIIDKSAMIACHRSGGSRIASSPTSFDEVCKNRAHWLRRDPSRIYRIVDEELSADGSIENRDPVKDGGPQFRNG